MKNANEFGKKISEEVKIFTTQWIKSKHDTANCSIFGGDYPQSGNPVDEGEGSDNLTSVINLSNP